VVARQRLPGSGVVGFHGNAVVRDARVVVVEEIVAEVLGVGHGRGTGSRLHGYVVRAGAVSFLIILTCITSHRTYGLDYIIGIIIITRNLST